jgi:hypothetical protein
MAVPAGDELVTLRARTQVRPARLAETRRPAPDIGICVAVLLLVAGPLPYLLRFDHEHDFTAALITLTLAACSFYSRQGVIVATMVFLAVLGDYRRYAGYFQGYPSNDPLLLVAPVIALLLLGQALLRGRRPPQTALSGLLLAMTMLMIVEIFNPVQGGIGIGFAGALFYVVPLLWFWVARAYASLEFADRFTMWVVVGIGSAAMLLGLYQTRFGLLPFEQQWVEQRGYQALYIAEEVVRAIGFFNSSAEYTRYLTLTAVTLLALWLTRRSRFVALLPLFLLAIFLSAARGPVVMVLLAMTVVWAVAARTAIMWVPRLGIAVAILGAALVATLVMLKSSSLEGRVAPLIERQVSGLLEPANQEKSTAAGHLEMIRDALVAGVLRPAGEGLGATTQAADKYGEHNRSAEVDFANLMISVGILGGALYAIIIVVVLARAVTWWRVERRPYALAALGSLVGTLGGWLIGGEYSAAALLWFQIGLLDSLSQRASLARRGSRVHAPGIDHA